VLDAPPAAVEVPEDAAPAERARFRLRIPKAVLVTVLGFALSAWLVPAMTRQWDDRQKEHELKAGVVADMASVSAQALVGGEAVWSSAGKRRVPEPKPTPAQKEWELSTLGLEARLRAYFPRSVVTSWEIYAWAVDRFLGASSPSASAALQDAVQSGEPLDPRVADATAQLLALVIERPGPSFKKSANMPHSDSINIPKLRGMLSPELQRYEQNYSYAKWTAVEKQLLDIEQAVADQVLRNHASGFSTTPRDLMHDLLP
jgi:hypothetical protein